MGGRDGEGEAVTFASELYCNPERKKPSMNKGTSSQARHLSGSIKQTGPVKWKLGWITSAIRRGNILVTLGISDFKFRFVSVNLVSIFKF